MRSFYDSECTAAAGRLQKFVQNSRFIWGMDLKTVVQFRRDFLDIIMDFTRFGRTHLLGRYADHGSVVQLLKSFQIFLRGEADEAFPKDDRRHKYQVYYAFIGLGGTLSQEGKCYTPADLMSLGDDELFKCIAKQVNVQNPLPKEVVGALACENNYHRSSDWKPVFSSIAEALREHERKETNRLFPNSRPHLEETFEI